MLKHESRVLLIQFEEYLLSRALSLRTAKEYPKVVEIFLKKLEQEGIYEIQDIGLKELMNYQSSLSRPLESGKLYASSSISSKMGTLKTFFKYLHKSGKIYHNPTEGLEIPSRGRGLPRAVLEIWEVESLLKQPDLETDLGLRDRAIIELLYSSGLRNEELRNLKMNKISLKSQNLIVKGKGAKEALIPFGDKAAAALENYLVFGRPKLLKQSSEELVFLSKSGSKLYHHGVNRKLKLYAIRAGIEKEVSAHVLRHSCATHLLKNGADLRLIQKLLRHEQIKTTEIYTRVDINDLKLAQKKYHPRELRSV